MAKKNSTKTATKEALQASEPRLMTYKGWAGINISQAPLGWNPIESGEFNESDLQSNYLATQNNANTTSTGAIETRHNTEVLAIPPGSLKFTGISCLRQDYLICAFSDNSIRWKKIGSGSKSDWTKITITNVDQPLESNEQWTSINYYGKTLVCLTGPKNENDIKIAGEIFTGEFNGNKPPASISNTLKIPDPKLKPTLTVMGSLGEYKETDEDNKNNVSRVSVGYVYTNKFGSTMDPKNSTDSNKGWATIIVSNGPERWHSGRYLNIKGNIKTEYGSDYAKYKITGVDLYCKVDENSDAIFIGHVDLVENQQAWSFDWLGSMDDTSVWTSVSLQLPSENTTKGVNASYMRVHDGRLYFWGGSDRYRLWIGGNPGNELSVARGTGGAFVDIEPDNGMEVKGTAKFKTYNGASIVTIMCSNQNTSKVKRYNLLETNLTISNELSTKGYSTEEVANVVGSMSHWGFGSWADGLYTINRYGLMLTTLAMESNNQLRAISVSGNVEPIFNDILAERLSNCHMIYINNILYIIMGTEESPKDNIYDNLDCLILCYDINSKAWWTYTYDDVNADILSVTNIDSQAHNEGLGIITSDKFCLIPTTGKTEPNAPENFEVIIETGELTVRQPPQQTIYLNQLEFCFDYFIGNIDIIVEGVDYYGRRRTIKKNVSLTEMKRNYNVWMRIDELFETYKLTIKGKARFRLTHFISKTYQESNKVNQVYGFTDHSYYANRHGDDTNIHHYIDSYNNLRDSIIP